MSTVRINPKEKIHTEVIIPGDKSITHRAVILASLAEGKSVIHNYLDADDCRRTIQAMHQMGVKIEKRNQEEIVIHGVGLDGLRSEFGSITTIDCGNSGTTMRLLAGVVAAQNFCTELFGDKSLSKRPMRRIVEPLRRMNVEITAVEDNYPPIKIVGNPTLKPITYELPIPSAQVKSCILLAGMQAKGITKVIEPLPSRDHTERMLKYFNAKISQTETTISVEGPVKLLSKEVFVPGDFSTAAFFIVAGILLKDSEIRIKNVGLNPKRTGLINILLRMGAKIEIENIREVCNEQVGDIISKSSKLKGTEIKPLEIPLCIDEIPLIVLSATQADGRTIITGAKELRVKESDRISSISTELNKLGAKIKELPDGFIIDGPTELRGANLESYGDHRIAMTGAIAGLIATGETTINNSECVEISFPNFWAVLEKL